MPEMPKPFKYGLAAQRENVQRKLAEINPNELPNRLGIVFDDSGSMAGVPLTNAKDAVKNFTLSCNQFDTSIAVIPLGILDKGKENLEKPLTVDYDLLNFFVSSLSLNDVGTPLYTVMMLALDKPVTRLVVFSDGEPTDTGANWAWGKEEEQKLKTKKDEWLEKFNELKKHERSVPHDTVFIGQEGSPGYNEMKWIAEITGGIFIHFKDSLSLSSGLKYLAPALRGFLANAELKERIQKGETI